MELATIEKLKAGDKKTLSHTATVKDKLTDDITEIKATLSITNAEIDDVTIEMSQTAEAVTALQGSVNLSAEARYYDDDLTKIGSGPIPPQVGFTTTYVLRWTVAAKGGDNSNIEVNASLPDNVTFAGSDDDRISYDKSSQTITLALKSVKASESKTVEFSVSVTPTKDDFNKLLVLVNEAILTAVDSNSDSTVQAQIDKTTSNLESDPGATDDGVVVKKDSDANN